MVDATKHTVKVTYGNANLDTEAAKKQNLKDDWADIANNEMKGYKGELNGKVTIPTTVNYNSVDWTVVAIGTCAFINERGNYKKGDIILEIVLPETIEYIEEAAFYQCIVWAINFPQNLKTIGRQAFYKGNLGYYYTYRKSDIRAGRRTARAKTSLKIPGQTAIGPQAFEECSTYTGRNVTLSCPNITYVGYQAFKGSALQIEVPTSANLGIKPTDKEITDMYKTLPGVDKRSGVEAFAQSKSKSVTLQNDITTIPTGMFDKAFENLAQFVIPLSVTTIEARAFANAGILSFSELSVVKKIGEKAFENGALAGDFVILDNVEEIGDGAFKGNTNLAGFTLKGSANCKVGAGILEGCTGLEYLDLRYVNSTMIKNNLKNLSREANSSTITHGLQAHTLVYLPDVRNISFAEGQDVNFVKFDGTCTKLVLEDGTDYEFPYGITANEVVYRRNLPSFSNGKNCFTIFLPYAVKLPEGIRAYNFDYLNKNGNSEQYMFKSVADRSTLEANRPYLLRIIDGKNHSMEEFKAAESSVKIAASGTDKLSKSKLLKPRSFVKGDSDQSYAFYGNTEKTSSRWYADDDLDSEMDYEFSPWVLNIGSSGKDVWRRYSLKQTYYMPPFRGAIMRIPGTSGAKQFMILSESETTGINDVTNDADAQQGAQRIYTIDGRYVGTDFDSLPSGMYIMKGKKTLKTK